MVALLMILLIEIGVCVGVGCSIISVFNNVPFRLMVEVEVLLPPDAFYQNKTKYLKISKFEFLFSLGFFPSCLLRLKRNERIKNQIIYL